MSNLENENHENIRNSTNDSKRNVERHERRSPSDLFRKVEQHSKGNKKILVPIRHYEKRRNAETSVMGTKR